jgi:hypothetical protein
MFIHIRLLAHVYYVYPHNVIGTCLLCLSTQSYKYISINILQTSQSDMFNKQTSCTDIQYLLLIREMSYLLSLNIVKTTKTGGLLA